MLAVCYKSRYAFGRTAIVPNTIGCMTCRLLLHVYVARRISSFFWIVLVDRLLLKLAEEIWTLLKKSCKESTKSAEEWRHELSRTDRRWTMKLDQKTGCTWVGSSLMSWLLKSSWVELTDNKLRGLLSRWAGLEPDWIWVDMDMPCVDVLGWHGLIMAMRNRLANYTCKKNWTTIRYNMTWWNLLY